MDINENKISELMNTLSEIKAISGAMSGDKNALLALLSKSHPEISGLVNTVNAVKGGDLYSLLPKILESNGFSGDIPKTMSKDADKKEKTSQKEVESFGLKPIADIANGSILKDIITLLG